MAEEVKPQWHDGWKTITTNTLILLLAFLPALRDYLGTFEGTEVAVAWVIQAIAIANLVLRFMTKGPVGQKLMMLTTGIGLMLGRKPK